MLLFVLLVCVCSIKQTMFQIKPSNFYHLGWRVPLLTLKFESVSLVSIMRGLILFFRDNQLTAVLSIMVSISDCRCNCTVSFPKSKNKFNTTVTRFHLRSHHSFKRSILWYPQNEQRDIQVVTHVTIAPIFLLIESSRFVQKVLTVRMVSFLTPSQD